MHGILLTDKKGSSNMHATQNNFAECEDID